MYYRERIYGDFLEGGMLIVVFCLSTDIANGGGGGGWIFSGDTKVSTAHLHGNCLWANGGGGGGF